MTNTIDQITINLTCGDASKRRAHALVDEMTGAELAELVAVLQEMFPERFGPDSGPN